MRDVGVAGFFGDSIKTGLPTLRFATRALWREAKKIVVACIERCNSLFYGRARITSVQWHGAHASEQEAQRKPEHLLLDEKLYVDTVSDLVDQQPVAVPVRGVWRAYDHGLSRARCWTYRRPTTQPKEKLCDSRPKHLIAPRRLLRTYDAAI